MSMLRSWEFKFTINRAANGLPLYLQIAQMIIEEIKKGRLKPLTAMPGSRELAESLQVNRKTVVMSYNELIAQGWLVTENRRGTFVPELLPIYTSDNIETFKFSNEVDPHDVHIEINISDKFRFSNSPYINLSNSSTDVRLLPYEVFSRAYRRALVTSTRHNMPKPYDMRGNLNLRKSIAEMLNMEKGFQITPDNICLVSSIQMGIFVAARVTMNQAGLVIFENSNNQSKRETFISCGATIIDVSVDGEGISVDEIENLCLKRKIQAVFVTSMHQFPTTIKLSNERRSQLLRLANQYDFLVIEDDQDFEYNFSHTPVFPVSSEDRNGKSLYIGSLTGSISPGFNIGYIVGNEKVIKSCAHELTLIDSQRNTAQEISLYELIKSGEIKRHMRRMTKTYRERRDCFKGLLYEELKDWVDFTFPENGLAFWIKFNGDININYLISEAQIQGLHLEIMPYLSNNITLQAIRIGFAAFNNAEMKDAVKRLKASIINSLCKTISSKN